MPTLRSHHGSWSWEFSCVAGGRGCGTRQTASMSDVLRDGAGRFYVLCAACGLENLVPTGLRDGDFGYLYRKMNPGS